MTTPQVPTPPAGTRWREVKRNGFTYRYAGRLESRVADELWSPVTSVATDNVPFIADLMATPTEPLPEPAVDRSGKAWEVMCKGLYRAMNYDTKIWAGLHGEAESLLRALAPHWREFAALAGEAVPKVTVLPGHWNVYDTLSMSHQTREAARKEAGKQVLHTAVRLAVVEDAS